MRMRLVEPPAVGSRTAKVFKTEEKGSDVNLATCLLLDAFRHDCDLAVVVSNDSDLEAPIRAVMNELGVPVGLVNPHPPSRRSRDLLNLKPVFFKQIRTSALQGSQFAEVLSDSHGTFRRPATW